MRMRLRVVKHTFTDLWRNRKMLNPLHSGFFAVQLISHKLLRYAVPFFLILLLGSSALLTVYSAFYMVIAFLQMTFYLFAALGWLLERGGRNISLFAVPLYFVLANLASLAGFWTNLHE